MIDCNIGDNSRISLTGKAIPEDSIKWRWGKPFGLLQRKNVTPHGLSQQFKAQQ